MSGSWPLLEEVKAFVATPGWAADRKTIARLERAIAEATDTLQPMPERADYDGVYGVLVSAPGTKLVRQAPRFLTSRDAAALLEAFVLERNDWINVSIEWNENGWSVMWLGQSTADHQQMLVGTDHDSEPVARTIAALEAGFWLGLWPASHPADAP